MRVVAGRVLSTIAKRRRWLRKPISADIDELHRLELPGFGGYPFTGFYGKPETSYRNESWQLLSTLRGQSSLPWMCAGDFNELLSNDEKIGVTNDWLTKFGASYEEHIPTTVSDHLFLYVRVSDHQELRYGRQLSFRFENMWCSHAGIEEVIRSAWEDLGGVDVVSKIHQCGEKLKQWDRNVFGNVKYKIGWMKREYDRRYNEAQLGGLTKGLQQCQDELNELYKQEELMWRQKSKATWLRDGDRNTTYFHSVASARRNRNLIAGIKDVDGNWQTDMQVIEREIMDYFQTIFASLNPITSNIRLVTTKVADHLSADMKRHLEEEFTPEERFWGIVGADVTNMALSFLNQGENQSAFVPERMIFDNAFIAFETIHFVRNKRSGRKKHMALKLDLSKAYDRVEWSFLEDIMCSMGFPSRWVALVMTCVRTNFEKASGQQINIDKSAIMFSYNTTSGLRDSIMQRLGVEKIMENDRYLGLPIMIGRSRTRELRLIKDRLWSRVNTWKGKLLSIAGKAVMIQSIAQSIPLYLMSCFQFPKSFIHELNMVIADFWWGERNGRKKIHWRSWTDLCVSKMDGGLGFRDYEAFNLSLLAKQCWRLVQNSDSLCFRLMKAKYFRGSNFMAARQGRNPSFLWRSLLAGRAVLAEGCRWRVGDGASIRVFVDKWINSPPSYKPMSQYVEDENLNIRVSDLIDVDLKAWRVDVLERLFSDEDKFRIQCLPLSSYPRCDSLVWNLDPMGQYTVKSGYFVARKLLGREEFPIHSRSIIWKSIWDARIYPKVRYFAWRLEVWNTSCPRMANFLEDEIEEMEFWSRLFSRAAQLGSIERVLFTLWAIWTNRNRCYHEVVCGSAIALTLAVAHHLQQMIQVFPGERRGGISTQLVRWMPPTVGSFKLNVDAAFDKNRGVAGLGAVIRDHNGDVRSYATKQLSFVSDLFYAEIYAIKMGLQLAKEEGLQRYLVESDCLVGISAINSSSTLFWEGACLIDEIRNLATSFESIRFRHLNRKANYCAHGLAKFAFQTCTDYVRYGELPPDVCNPDLQF
ncbi:reverse transcriptase [Corchorus capsularis]|uniref:Reverse transcriptase n=1 Tax=Corchorus capsularis TaxID=210143 RepID=A0A1R3G9C4_COCAP|nr:reverse transcriptase [Corchorus capsularis]